MLLSPLLLFAIAAGAFLAGLAAGYAANRRGGVWRRRFIVERDYYAAYRDQSETLLAEKLRRIAKLESQLESALGKAPHEPAPAPPPPEASPEPEPAPAPEPAPIIAAEPEPLIPAFTPMPEPIAAEAPSPRGADVPLTRLRGVTPALAGDLAAHGIRTLRDIETLSPEDEMALEIRLELPAGYIARHQWRLQAALLDETAS